MNPLKKLASQTAIYGIPSILGRFLYYLLVPIHVRIFDPPAYGVVTYFYSYVAFLAVFLTFGLETTYFRFSETPEKEEKVYSTAFIFQLGLLAGFVLVLFVGAQPIANWMKYPTYANYVRWFALIIAMDAFTALPFARLRKQSKALKFAGIRMVNIVVYILLNFVFLKLFPALGWYNAEIGVGYIFIANLAASAITLLLLAPDWIKHSWKVDVGLLRKLLRYSAPIMIAGLAGMINETFDRIVLKDLLPAGSQTDHELGVYGACYKLAMIMSIVIQAYRFAAEPFFFSRLKEKDNHAMYAKTMNYFVALCCVMFLGVTFYLDIFKWFLAPKFFEGLKVVPILLIANMFLGIYINLSMWYKLNNQTKYGVYFSFFGAAVTIVLLFTLVPNYHYMGAAWATLVCYVSMALLSFVVGQKLNPMPYQTAKILSYIGLSVFLFWIGSAYLPGLTVLTFIVKACLILAFIVGVYISERGKKALI